MTRRMSVYAAELSDGTIVDGYAREVKRKLPQGTTFFLVEHRKSKDYGERFQFWKGSKSGDKFLTNDGYVENIEEAEKRGRLAVHVVSKFLSGQYPVRSRKRTDLIE